MTIDTSYPVLYVRETFFLLGHYFSIEHILQCFFVCLFACLPQNTLHITMFPKVIHKLILGFINNLFFFLYPYSQSMTSAQIVMFPRVGFLTNCCTKREVTASSNKGLPLAGNIILPFSNIILHFFSFFP